MKHQEILNENMAASAKKGLFQQDRDPKHTANLHKHGSVT